MIEAGVQVRAYGPSNVNAVVASNRARLSSSISRPNLTIRTTFSHHHLMQNEWLEGDI